MSLTEYLQTNLLQGGIAEIAASLCAYYEVDRLSLIRTEDKLSALCIAAGISRTELDEMIANNPPAIRTIKGHAFEVIFSKLLQLNDIPHEEIGGDTDIDFEILGKTLQLKTPYVKGCKDGVMAYKTHKTHGAKSENESSSYYHLANDFADYLVGLISYDPFQVLILPRDSIPRWRKDPAYLRSPVCFELEQNEAYINNFTQLGVTEDITYPSIVSLGSKELLPLTASDIGVRSNYIIDAIFRPENFRIWDMNLRGFIREKHMQELVLAHGLNPIDPHLITDRPEKVDLVLERKSGGLVRFQIKGLTIGSSRFKGMNSTLLCETQLSRGHVNDHPTQSRLYLSTDFDQLLVAMDPAYTNLFSKACYGVPDFQWSLYAIPVDKLKRHHQYQNRLSSSQILCYAEIQQYRLTEDWFSLWK